MSVGSVIGERFASSPVPMEPSPSRSAASDAASESSSAAATSCAIDDTPDLDDQSNSSPNPKDMEIQSAASLRSEEYRQLFRLPAEEVILQDFNCALQESILLQGHMYLFVHYICFYSNIFGFETKKVIAFSEVTSVKRAKTAGIFPNAIEILAGGKKYFFASFLSRDEAFKLINDGWLHSENVAKAMTDQQESVSGTSSQDNGVIAIEKVNSFNQVNELESSGRQKDAPPNNSQSLPGVENDLALPPQDNAEQIAGPVGNTESSSSTKTWKWKVEDFEASEIPKSYTTVAETKFPVKVEEFFNLFFSDDAISFVESFRERCGDKEFRCSLWSPDEKFGHVRNLSFQHPIKIYLGAKYGSCKEVQKFRVYRNSHLVIETSQEINDVPYGDYFTVEGLWDVVRDSNGSKEGCILRVNVDVAFSKRTVFKGKIVQSTLDECREAYTLWIKMAHEVLRQRNLEKQEEAEEGPSASAIQNGEVHSATEVNTREALERIPQMSGSIAINERVSNLVHRRFENASSVTSLFRECTTKLISFLTSQSQISLILAVAFSVIFLMQLSIVVLLHRPQNVQVAPPQYYPGSMGGGFGDRSAETVAWLERRMHHLKDEMLMVEARLERIRHEHAWLNSQLKDLKIPRKHSK